MMMIHSLRQRRNWGSRIGAILNAVPEASKADKPLHFIFVDQILMATDTLGDLLDTLFSIFNYGK